MNNFDLKNYFKKQYLEEGTCGYTPDGKPRSKPASSDLMKEAEYAADKFNVNAFGYQTKYYKVCPSAKAFMDKVVAGDYGDMSDKKPQVIRLAKLHDLLFLDEIRSLKDPKYAADIIGQVEYIADTIKDMVDTLGIPVRDVDYVDNHVKIIKDAAKKLNENQDDSYYIDEIKRDLEELDDKEANEYLEDLAKAILKLKR